MRYFWLFILLFCSIAVVAQNSKRMRNLENRRKAVLSEIKNTNRLLSRTKKSHSTALNRLELLTRQINARKEVIALLTGEMEELDKEMVQMTADIELLQLELGNKKDRYAVSLRKMQNHKKMQDKLLFILSAKDFGQSLRRIRYLKKYSDWQKEQADEIILKRSELDEKKIELLRTKEEKALLLKEREDETVLLEKEELAKKEEVRELDEKQNTLLAELEKKKQQARDLDRQIEKIIKEDIARSNKRVSAVRSGTRKSTANKKNNTSRNNRASEKEKEVQSSESKGYILTKEDQRLSSSFVKNRGRLPFPLKGYYKVVARFGQQKHQDLKYVRINNNGIDLQTTDNNDAVAVFNGVVTKEFSFGGVNNIIVRHGAYLTVYSNLSKMYVKTGEKVTTGQPLGRIMTDPATGNTILHFEIWKETTKLNPLHWLN